MNKDNFENNLLSLSKNSIIFKLMIIRILPLLASKFMFLFLKFKFIMNIVYNLYV